MSTRADQQREHRAGVRRMLLLTTPSPIAYVQQHLTGAEKLSLAASPYRSTAQLFDDCLAACIDAVLPDEEVWTKTQFEQVRDRVSATIVEDLFAAVSVVAAILVQSRAAQKAISAASSMALIAPLADAREQLDCLVFPGFIVRTGVSQLRRLPVYLAGISHRVARLAEHPARDRAWLTEVQTATERYRAAGGALPQAPDASPQLVRARLAARGIPAEFVRAASRHRGIGVAAAHHQGARRRLRRHVDRTWAARRTARRGRPEGEGRDPQYSGACGPSIRIIRRSGADISEGELSDRDESAASRA